jgi:hypothetical protein
VYFAGDSAREAWHGFEFFEGSAQEGFRGAEVGENFLFACGADAGEVVEDGGDHGATAQFAMVGVGEAVRLVADALEQVQLGRVAFQDDRLGAAWFEDFFVAFGQ